MISDEQFLMWLDSLDFMTYKKKEKLLSLVDRPTEFVTLRKFTSLKDKILNFLTQKEFTSLINALTQENVNKLNENLKKNNIDYITIYSKNYPHTLKNIDTPPFVLYYKGNLDLLNTQCFGIVGTRHITNYGKLVTEKFATDLVKANFTIVSGLASGVDTVAHTTTLNHKGKTIGVLAGGLDNIYPLSNTNLAKEIIRKGGLLISETRPYKKAEKYMFPIRNRIIAGLSRGILITEAGEKSGALHTKNYAIDYGRDVFSVPANISSITSVGSNQMIVNGQAKAVISPQDILNDYNITLNSIVNSKTENITMEESLIVNLLKEDGKSFQEILIKTKLDAKTLNSLLTTLLIRGIIKKLAGNVYYLKE